MAVAGQDNINLAPAYANITDQLKQRANMEATRVSPFDVGTQVVNRVDKELTAKRAHDQAISDAQRAFEQKMSGEGRVLMTPDKTKMIADSLNEGLDPKEQLDPAKLSSMNGLYLTQEEANSIAGQKMMTHTITTADKRGATNVAPGTAAKSVLEKTKNIFKVGKSDTSSTGYTLYSINPTTLEKTDTLIEQPDPGIKGAKAPKPLPSTELEKSTALNDLSSQYQSAIDNFHPDLVGPYNARAGRASQSIPGLADEQKGKFYSAVQGLQNDSMHKMFGSRLTGVEIGRYSGPTDKKNAEDFKARMVQSAKQINKDIAARQASYKDSGYTGVVPPAYINIPPEWDKSNSDKAAIDYLTKNNKVVNSDTIKAANNFLSGK